jgi:hypothetical protein
MAANLPAACSNRVHPLDDPGTSVKPTSGELTSSHSQVGRQLYLPLLQRGDSGPQPSELTVDPVELRPGLLVLQVAVPMLLLD